MVLNSITNLSVQVATFLFTFYTSDFQYNSKSCHLQKFSDDFVIVGCIKHHDESEYRELMKSFVDWFDKNREIDEGNSGWF